MNEDISCAVIHRLMLVLVVGFAPSPLSAASDAEHGQFGPYDYYNPPAGAISLVERAHMGLIIAKARHQGRWCYYYDNLDYALRAFPNHPEALTLMAEYLEDFPPCSRGGAQKAARGRSPMELATAIESGAWRERNADYYFQKGLEFKPKDSPKSTVKRPETRVLYGKYLYRQKRADEALNRFMEAVTLDKSATEAHYYLGLIYFDKNEPEKAKAHIEQAHKLGRPPEELKQQLISIGQWQKK